MGEPALTSVGLFAVCPPISQRFGFEIMRHLSISAFESKREAAHSDTI